MKTKTCVDCGEKFTITDSELAFYQKKGLSEPKRCVTCREKKQKINAAKETIPAKSSVWLMSSCVFFLLSYLSFQNKENIRLALGLCFLALFFFALGIFLFIDAHSAKGKAVSAEYLSAAQNLENVYRFSSTERLKEHFQKHHAETNSKTPKEYVQKANAVIQNKQALKKKEKTDGDDVYYLEKTGEIVFVSRYGNLRTYYIATKDYFNRT